MRPISEIGMEDSHPAPTQGEIADFEATYGITLPTDYVQFLSEANGGSPDINRFEYTTQSGNQGESAVSVFFSLTSDNTNLYGIRANTDQLREIFQSINVQPNVVSIGENGGGDQIFLDYSVDPPKVRILYRTSANSTPLISENFGSFIDSLFAENFDTGGV